MAGTRRSATHFVLLTALLLALTAVGSAASVSKSDINITSDQTFYTCSPDCTAYVNVTNNGTINTTSLNLTVFNTYSTGQDVIDFTLEEHDSGSWAEIGDTNGDSFTLANHEFLNRTPSSLGKTYRFRLNITADQWGKWNVTLQVNTSSTPAQNITLDPYIQEFRNEGPFDNDVLNDQTPTFTFSYVSPNETKLKCGALVNETGNPPLDRKAINATTRNDTRTDITVNNSKKLSHGTYKWRYWCDSDADDTVESGEVSSNKTLFIDTEPPATGFNTPASGAIVGSDVIVDVNVTDEFTDVNASTVALALGNNTANYSADGVESAWTSMQEGGRYPASFNASINVSSLASGDYDLWVNASDDFNQTSHTKQAITIDTTPPDVRDVTINTTSTSGDNITQEGFFNLTARVSDSVAGIRACRALAYEDGTLKANDSLDVTSTNFRNGTLDLTGQDGNYTISVACTDDAGNTGSNTTLRMPNGATTEWFAFDDSGPIIDLDTTTPVHGSYTNDQTDISFNVSDFSGIRTGSVAVWFNSTKYSLANTTANFSTTETWGTNSSTIYLAININSFNDDANYTLTFSANDSANDSTVNQTYWFHTDFTAPQLTGITDVTADGDTLDRDGTTWHHEAVDLNVTCSDNVSYSDTISLSGSNGDGGTTTLGSGTTEGTASFTADTGFEGSIDVSVSCTDAAGNSQTNTSTYSIDNDRPEIDQQIPAPGSSLSESPTYSQQILLKVVDNGVGFDASPASPDPQFDGSSVSSYEIVVGSSNTSYRINWSQSIDSNGTHTVALGGGNGLDISDRFGQTLGVASWEFKVSGSSGDGSVTTTDTSNASLAISGSPDSITMVPGESRTVQMTVENNGDASASVDASTSSGNGIGSVTASPSSFSIDSGGSTTVDVTVEAADSLSGSADVTVTFSHAGGSVSTTITVNEEAGTGSLAVLQSPAITNIVQGNSSVLQFTVENTGERRLTGLTSSLTSYSVDFEPDDFALVPGEQRTVNASVSVSRNASITVRNVSYSLGNGNVDATAYVRIGVQPASQEKRDEIIRQVKQLAEKVERIRDPEKKAVAKNLVSAAQKALTKGNYAKAASLSEEIDARVKEAELAAKQSDGLPVLPIVLIGLIILLGGAIGGYMLFIKPEDDGSSKAASSTSRVEEIGKLFEQGTANVITAIEGAIGSLTSQSTDASTAKEEHERRVKKKIRFEDVDQE